MKESILVPLDGSPFGEQALPYAMGLARESGMILRLVHVFLPLPPPPSATVDDGPETRDGAERYLANLAASLAAVLHEPVETEVRTGRAVDGILEAAARPDTSMIVMTSHGRSGWKRAWLGSVADGVIRGARRPVVVVKPSPGRVNLGVTPWIGRILIPLDGSSLSEQIVPVARRWGDRLGAHFTVLRVIGGHPRIAFPALPDIERIAAGLDDRQARAYLVEQATALAPAWVEVATRTAPAGGVASAILDMAGIAGADMIALATHGRGGLRRVLLGSVADRVFRNSRVPVMLLRPARTHRRGSRRRAAVAEHTI